MFGNKNQEVKDISILHLDKVSSYEDYISYANKQQKKYIKRIEFEKSLVSQPQKEFLFNGYCYICKQIVDFKVDFTSAYEVIDNILMPNWRERLICPVCHLNNRMRAAAHIFQQECKPNSDSKIYVTEQTTPFYNWIIKNFLNVYGSEYLGDCVPYGSCNDKGIQNENITQLSFNNNELNYILSFDVFEHIFNYKKALIECYRCLKLGGVLYFSVPFIKTAKKNTLRACVEKKGEIKHFAPPEYHGDPLNSDGCLCFYHFGWEILDELNSIGFEKVSVLLYWSQELGYLGGEQSIFTATKTGQ